MLRVLVRVLATTMPPVKIDIDVGREGFQVEYIVIYDKINAICVTIAYGNKGSL